MAEGHIPLERCRARVVYRLRSRNLSAGVFDGRCGFVGIREKFGSHFCFTEYHWDQGPPYGTVFPLEAMRLVLPEEISLATSLGSRCGVCERRLRYDRSRYDQAVADGRRPGDPDLPEVWHHLDDTGADLEAEAVGDARPDAHRAQPWSIQNDALFSFLKVPTALAQHRNLEEYADEAPGDEWIRSHLEHLHLHPPTYEPRDT